ncbi:MAG: tungsten ABC transporter substrate-binding protein, partial [Gammaproteobacteria bacterium RIFOXYB2_FULL_38_6]
KFVANGFGINRRDVMYNDFVILGPASDPANAQSAKTAAEALKKIAAQKAVFVSRGDDSGTHQKELELWQGAKIKPSGSWYNAVGQGMGATMQIANEKQGYTLADRATYLAYMNKIDSKIVFEGEDSLFNPYGVIAVNPARHKKSNYMGAMALIGWLTSVDGQKIIKDFQINGQPLFIPVAIK